MTRRKTSVDPDQLVKQSGNSRERPNTYTFKCGRTVTLDRLGEPMLVGLYGGGNRPKPPKREVEMAGGGMMRLDRADDEPLFSEIEIEEIKNKKKREEEREYRKYRLALQDWEMKKSLIFARTVFLAGVVEGPTAEETELWQAIGWADPYDIKYNWLAHLCREPEEWNSFIEAVISYSMPTEEGIDEMQELFRASMEGPSKQTMGADLDLGEQAEA